MNNKEKILISISSVLGATAVVFASLFTWKVMSGNNHNNVETIETHLVTFESNGGSHVKTVEVNHDDKLIRPEDPNKLGYTFDNWYTDASLVTPYNFDAAVTSDLTLYAKWTQFDVAVTICVETEPNEQISFSCGDDSVFSVDWGDGSPVDNKTSHVYLDSFRYTIIIKGSLNSFALHCPETYIHFVNLHHVNSLDDFAFASHTKLQSITLPNNLTNITNNAFASCYALTSIDIPDSVTTIGNYAFAACDNLTTVNIGGDNSRLVSISNTAFDHCPELVYYPNDGVNYLGNSEHKYLVAMNTSEEKESYTLDSNCKIIYRDLFSGNTALTSIEIPDSVTSIGDNAFNGCSNLSTITFVDDSQLSYIGQNVFSGCSTLLSSTTSYNNADYVKVGDNDHFILFKASDVSITSCAIHEDCRFIYNSAFENCASLTEINIPDNVISLGPNAFRNCTQLMTINISDNSRLSLIDDRSAYGCSNLQSINIPNSVKLIGYEAFYKCTNLATVNISDDSHLSSINGCAFERCSKLTSINIPDCINYVGGDAFYGCSSLSTTTFENARYLGNNINKCLILVGVTDTSMTSYTIDKRCKFIFERAFEECAALTLINIPRSVITIGAKAFQNCSNLTAVIFEEGSHLSSIGEEAFNRCIKLISFDIPDGTATLDYGVFYECSNLATVNISNHSLLTSIPSGCFFKCSNLTAFNLPRFINGYINSQAFYGCSSLTSINIPDSVIAIDSQAFKNCTNLRTVTISSESQLTMIDNEAFFSCASLISITLPDGLEDIQADAFRDCSSLTSINIPSSVTSIGGNAFYNCTSLEYIDLTSFSATSTAEDIPLIPKDSFIKSYDLSTLYVSDDSDGFIQLFIDKGWPEDKSMYVMPDLYNTI